MWAALTLDCPTASESQAQCLMGINGENGPAPKTVEQAESLRPLRDTGPSVLREKKVRIEMFSVLVR